ncbi:MAG: ABC transporter substrate-binding protein, partial [Desulfobacterales bacterium]|nr:ABC transporter substrate-binding protein [Desulfobacterales bacterium]
MPKKIIPKIGMTQTVSYPDFDADAKGFEKALAEAGFREGIHVIYDRQNAQGDVNHAQTIAEKFINSSVDLIHSIGTPSSRAVMKIIKDVPIVFSSVTDPVYAGLIPKTSPLGTRTGTNVTGVSDRWPVTLQFEMYTKFIPKAKKWGTIYSAADPRSLPYIKEIRQAAKKVKVELIEVNISQSDETLPAAQFLVGKVQTIYITYDHIALSSFEPIVKVCNQKKIPLFGGDLKSVTMGAMAAYGWDYFQIGHSAGRKAARILKGEKPGDIPWDSGEKLVLLINEK